MEKKGDLNGYQLVHMGDNYLGEILKERRLVLRMTQKQVAEKAKVSLPQYQKFENGSRNIMTASFQLACRVIEALEMNISKFYHGEYAIGEEIFLDKDGVMRYVKTGLPINQDITEENKEQQ